MALRDGSTASGMRDGGSAGAGHTQTGSSTPGPLALELHAGGKPASAVTLSCFTPCVELEAVVSGGSAPYSYTWSDATLSGPGPHEVCPKSATEYRVSVGDTPAADGEFKNGMHAEATVAIDYRACEKQPLPKCKTHASTTTFDPVVKWHFTGDSMITPLVANLTDDNGDGKIDSNDTPDVVFVGRTDGEATPRLIVLDGKTGLEHFRLDWIEDNTAPAIADMDGDHVPDLVVVESFGRNDGKRRMAVLDHTGKDLWVGDTLGVDPASYVTPPAIAVADLDHDGKPEILCGSSVFDTYGKRLWQAPEVRQSSTSIKLGGGPQEYISPIAVDLDGDQYLEVIWGSVAYRYDGTLYYKNDAIVSESSQTPVSVYVAAADLDADGRPEILVTAFDQLYVLDNHGKMLRGHYLPSTCRWAFPPAVADLNGDGAPDILVTTGRVLYALKPDMNELWYVDVNDMSGSASPTAFDFFGDGSAEAMFGDEHNLKIYDATSKILYTHARGSGTEIEYATVADVDADGSADFLVVSSNPDDNGVTHGLEMISDRYGRFVPARRIMNEDSYHVTNVEDDGTIPRFETPHYLRNNTFRAQAQIDDNGVCVP